MHGLSWPFDYGASHPAVSCFHYGRKKPVKWPIPTQRNKAQRNSHSKKVRRAIHPKMRKKTVAYPPFG